MAHLSNLHIDLRGDLRLGCNMRLILSLSLFSLTACATFPQVDAAASKSMAQRPALLTLDQINALTAKNGPVDENRSALLDDLNGRSTVLRNR